MKMSVKYFSKLFTHQYQNRLFRFPNPILNIQFRILSHSEPTVREETYLEDFSNKNPRICNVIKTPSVYSYLKKNHEKYDLVKIEDIDLTEETNFKSLVLLKNLVDCSRNSSPEEQPEVDIIPEALLNCIESECSSYSLNDIFKYIILASKVRNKDSTWTLIRYLNAELHKRVLTKQEHFKILYLSKILFNEIFLKSDFKYIWKMLIRLTEKIKSLTPEQVVVLFSIMRRLPKERLRQHKFNVKLGILENLPKFSMDELIIVSRGLLISDIQIKMPALPVALTEKLLEEIKNPYDLPIYWVFKVIGFNAEQLGYDKIAEFQEKIIPYAGKYVGQDLVWLARSGAKMAYVNLTLWDILANNFKQNIKNYSLDQIEKMVHMTVICNIQDEEFLKMSVEEFQNADLSISSSRFFISFVYDLIHHQIYPEKLLSLLLSKDFRLKYNLESFGLNVIQQYCFIDSFIKFHRPESNFEFLESERELKLYKFFNIHPEQREAQFLCYKILKKPHFRRGIIMRFDKNLEAQPIPEQFILSNENYKKALNDDHIWLFIKTVRHSNFKQGTDIPNFETQTEIREMEAFGYAPVLIRSDLWKKSEIKKNSEDCLQDVIKNKVWEVKNKQMATI